MKLPDKCPQCGFKVQIGQMLCRNCGSRLLETASDPLETPKSIEIPASSAEVSKPVNQNKVNPSLSKPPQSQVTQFPTNFEQAIYLNEPTSQEKGKRRGCVFSILIILSVMCLFNDCGYNMWKSYRCLKCDKYLSKRFLRLKNNMIIPYSSREYPDSIDPLPRLMNKLGWGSNPHVHNFVHTYSDGNRGIFMPISAGLHGRGLWANQISAVKEFEEELLRASDWNATSVREIVQSRLITGPPPSNMTRDERNKWIDDNEGFLKDFNYGLSGQKEWQSFWTKWEHTVISYQTPTDFP